MKKKSVLADFSLLMVAFVWGSTFAVIKDVLSEAQPLNMMGIRFILATILLSIMFHKKLKKTTKEAFKGGIIIGLFLFIAMATQTIGLVYTTASKQAFLTGTNVVMVPFFVWMVHKKRPDKYAFIGAFLAIVGIGLLTLDGSFSFSTFNKGDVLTLVCAVFFACHIISIGHFTKKYDPVVLSIVQFGVTGILFAISAMVFESFTLNVGAPVMKAILYLALAGTAFAYTVQNVAQKYTSSSHAAIILCLEAVFGSLLAVILLGEVLTKRMILGCAVIFIGIILTETKLEFLKKKNTDVSLENGE
ncbi:MAG: DMT family transporter [Marinisporobacter sp.]|nr:DMT family transporter [Marinisporobacter sp.]